MSVQVAIIPNVREVLENTNKSTQKTSASFLKKAVSVLISTFCKLRDAYPTEAFWKTKPHDSDPSIRFEILKRDCQVTGVDELIELIKSSLKGVDDRYLDEIRVMPIEEMIMKWDYTDAITSEENLHNEMKSLDHTVQNMQNLCKFLQPLPEKGNIFFTLLYNDEITPENYEPELYKRFDLGRYPKIDGCKIKIGEVYTSFHCIRLYIRSKFMSSQKKVLETKTSWNKESSLKVRCPSRMEKPSHEVYASSKQQIRLSTIDVPQVRVKEIMVKSKVMRRINKYYGQNKTDLLKRTRSSTGALVTKMEKYYYTPGNVSKKKKKQKKKKLIKGKENTDPNIFSTCGDNVYEAPAICKDAYLSKLPDVTNNDKIDDADLSFKEERKASCCVEPAIFGSLIFQSYCV